MHRVLIFDTSVLCVWLSVPGKRTCGPKADRWDGERIERLIQREIQAGATFVLPLAAIIETGNHISQARQNRYETALRLGDIIEKTAIASSPWAAFTEQAGLWEADGLTRLARAWPAAAAEGLSIGDLTIREVAEYYARTGAHVEILTGDAGLKAYTPRAPTALPRPRRRR